MDEISAFDNLMLSIRPVFDFMLYLWKAIPAEIRFVFALFVGIAIIYAALRSLVL